jgi:hypothetical protein
VVVLAEFDTAGTPTDGLDESLATRCYARTGRVILRRAGSDGQLLDRLRLLLGAHASGIAEATQDMSVSYAKERTQFGQPMGPSRPSSTVAPVWRRRTMSPGGRSSLQHEVTLVWWTPSLAEMLRHVRRIPCLFDSRLRPNAEFFKSVYTHEERRR